MKTLFKNISIEFALRATTDNQVTIDLLEDVSSMKNSLKISTNGLFIGSYTQILQTNIIFYN